MPIGQLIILAIITVLFAFIHSLGSKIRRDFINKTITAKTKKKKKCFGKFFK